MKYALIAAMIVMLVLVMAVENETILPLSVNETAFNLEPVENISFPSTISEPELSTLNESFPVNLREEVPAPIKIKSTLALIADKITVLVQDIITLQAILRYENDTPIIGEEILFTSISLSVSNITDEQGLATVSWNISPAGTHIITAQYGGDDIVEPNSAMVEIHAEQAQAPPMESASTSRLISNPVPALVQTKVSPSGVSYEVTYEAVETEQEVYREETIPWPERCYAENNTCVPAHTEVHRTVDRIERISVPGRRGSN